MAGSFRYRNKSNMDIFEIFPYGIQFFLLQQIITLNNLYISAVFECFVMKRSNKEEIIVQSFTFMDVLNKKNDTAEPDRQTGRWIDRKIERQLDRKADKQVACTRQKGRSTDLRVGKIYIYTDIQIDKQTNKELEKQMDRQIYTKTDIQIDRKIQINSQTGRRVRQIARQTQSQIDTNTQINKQAGRRMKS